MPLESSPEIPDPIILDHFQLNILSAILLKPEGLTLREMTEIGKNEKTEENSNAHASALSSLQTEGIIIGSEGKFIVNPSYVFYVKFLKTVGESKPIQLNGYHLAYVAAILSSPKGLTRIELSEIGKMNSNKNIPDSTSSDLHVQAYYELTQAGIIIVTGPTEDRRLTIDKNFEFLAQKYH